MPYMFQSSILAARAKAINPPHSGAEVRARLRFHKDAVKLLQIPSTTREAESYSGSRANRFFGTMGIPQPSTVALDDMSAGVQDAICFWKGRRRIVGDRQICFVRALIDTAVVDFEIFKLHQVVALELTMAKMESDPELPKTLPPKRPASPTFDEHAISKKPRRTDNAPSSTLHPTADAPRSRSWETSIPHRLPLRRAPYPDLASPLRIQLVLLKAMRTRRQSFERPLLLRLLRVPRRVLPP
ncbi:hypothetical protein FOMPIDRAFT_1054595 [Fomitopsis schrenkii]|uniref:Uncharacterized protein n=1 Tax=Fomitopsis schrenkii TaxID=2126942 RepID=S8F855_FOMSC|nr:hypothetical protein FOMPIDRAFT_1054595 [Fomitopsis schrenkii]